jgi:hypothetical protein
VVDLTALPPLPETLTAITGNGHHYYFAVTEPTRKSKPMPGIDFQADGSYVILPNARHVSGRQYAWRDPAVPIASLPQVLLDAVAAPTGQIGHAGDGEPFPEGTRNDSLYREVERLAIFGIKDRSLQLTAHAINQDRCKPPLSMEEVEAIIASAAKRGAELSAGQLDWLAASVSASVDSPVEAQARVVPGGDFILDEPEGIPAVWGDGEQVLWAEGEGVMLHGHQGVGKTTIAQQLVLHRIGVRDGPFLGLTVAVSDRPVLYLAMDRPRQAARSFRRMVNELDRPALNKGLVIHRGPLPINPVERPGNLADFAEMACPDVGTIVVDSLKDLAPGLTDDKIGAALNMMFQEIIARGIELVLLHHERKAENAGRRASRLDDVYGSTWLTSGLGSVIALVGDPGDPTIELHHSKQPGEPVGPLTIRHDHANGLSTLADAVSLWQIMRAAGAGGLTKKQAAQALFGRASGNEIKRITTRFKKWGDLVGKKPGTHTAEGYTGDTYFLLPLAMQLVDEPE